MSSTNLSPMLESADRPKLWNFAQHEIETLDTRSQQIFAERSDRICTRTDHLFIWIFILQWIAAILAALLISPRTWDGTQSAPHIHLYAAVVLGGLLTSLPVVLAIKLPGRLVTRLVISGAQAGFSALLIYITGGRIETHFHIFGSLAILATYRDYRALIPATIVTVADHYIRGYFWPESVFGILAFNPWRAFEHAGWVLFEDIFLVWSCVTSTQELKETSLDQAKLEMTNTVIEDQVSQRTKQLAERTLKLEESMRKEATLETRLFQAQKLESIGQLAAGVAHEINSPMQFVNDNMEYLSDCTKNLFVILDAYQDNLSPNAGQKSWQERKADISRLLEESRFEYMRGQVPQAIDESLEGIQRVITIVRAMKEFSHSGTTAKVSTDINQALRSTAAISKNRWKYCADLEFDLADNLPDVKALPSELNQVFLNLVVNASDAIASKVGEDSNEKGLITLRTYSEAGYVVIAVEDTGCGISEEIRHRVYDPFFTTKEVGKGTGQGLAISHDIVVNKHGGKLDMQSTPGVGTTFFIRLPSVPHPESQESTFENELKDLLLV
jgi:signal transduction histidine kinase